ncbi:MAG: hypothetical protein GX326_06050, partial [Clostridiaceae bacterium]|nr:hypothetical protein [Clostridiaceae bacterium]
MKKWLSSLLILSILISLSACSFIEKDISQLITKTDNNLTETESSKSRTVQTKASETQEEIDVEQTGSQMTKSDDPKSEDEDFLNLGNYVKTRPLPSDLANLASSRDYSPSSANENIDIMIDLPEILLDSPDAKQVNDEITALENTMVEIFEREMDEYGESEGFYYYQYVDYSAYARNGVLSICIEVTDNLFSEICGHYIYNFSLANGALLNDQELIELLTDQKLNMDLLWEENIAREAKKIHDQFEHEMKSNYLEEQYSEPFYAGISDHFVGRTLLNIRTQNYVSLDIAEKNPQASKLFIDESGILKMIYGLMSAAGSGYNLVDADFYPNAFPSER